MPIPDSNFVASVPLQYYFVNKDDGTPLASGIVTFYSDPDFSVLKSVYQLTLNPDNTITFATLSNPLILSGIGTFVDGSGNNVVPYYFPFDGIPGDPDPGNFQPYFITVQSSTGVLQFTLQEWPPNSLSDNGGTSSASQTTLNQITNPQFSVFSFNESPATSSLTFAVTGTGTRNSIAPGWEVVTSGAGNVIISQLSINEDIPTEATSSIQIETTGAITAVALVQRITSDPRILSNPTTIAESSYISGYVVARAAISTTASVSMTYVPSNGVVTTVFDKLTNATHEFISMSGTAAIDTPLSTDGNTGYTDIIISISPLTSIEITSVQVVGVAGSTIVPGFVQISTQQQLSDLSWYYNPQWSFKPIKSYLVGWDFPLNPAQALGYTVGAQSVGTNKGFYAWDQTIVYQTVDSGVSVARGSSGQIVLTAALAGQMGLIQYLDAYTAKKILLQELSVNVLAKASAATTATVSLWYTTSTLPTLPTTFVTTLDANGHPSAVAAGWVEVPRNVPGNAIFSIGASATDFNNYGLSGWDLDDTAIAASATFFAIVIGTQAVLINTTVSFESISLVPGLIPTIPAPQTINEVLSDCRRYYQMSFVQGTIPVSNATLGHGESYFIQRVGAATAGNIIPVVFYPPMFNVPVVTLYNPAAAGAEIRDTTANVDYSVSSAINVSQNACTITGISNVGSTVLSTIAINWTADARLGTY